MSHINQELLRQFRRDLWQHCRPLSSNERRITIAYHGAAVVGKSTNLSYLHANLPFSDKSDLAAFHLQETDLCVTFDFVHPAIAAIAGQTPRFYLVTLRGAMSYRESCVALLAEADAVVFVADAQFDRLEANLGMFAEMEQTLRQAGRALADFPWVIQYNKQDLPNIAPTPYLQFKLNKFHAPYFETAAKDGVGVCETLAAIVELAAAACRKTLCKESSCPI